MADPQVPQSGLDTLGAPSEAQPAINTATEVKGPWSIGKIGGKTPVDPGLLENMQQLIDEREAQKNSFMENLKDATAWWSGGAAGPSAELRARAAEREGVNATTFSMKSQLAQYKAAQENAKVRAQSIKQALDSASNVTPSKGGMPAVTKNSILRLLSEGDIDGAETELRNWTKTESGNISKSTYDATANTPVTNGYPVAGVGSLVMTPNQFRAYDSTGDLPASFDAATRQKAKAVWQLAQSQPTQAAATTTTGTAPAQAAPAPTAAPAQTAPTQGTAAPATPGVLPHAQPLAKVNPVAAEPLALPDREDNFPVLKGELATATSTSGNAAALAQELGVKLLSGDRDNAKQTQLYQASLQPGYKGPPVAKPGTSQHEFGNAIDVDPAYFDDAARQKLVAAGFVQPVKNDPNHWELASARQKTPIATAPAQVAVPGQAATPVVPAAKITPAPITTPSLPAQKAALAANAQAPAAAAPAQANPPGFKLPYPNAVVGVNPWEEDANRKYREDFGKSQIAVQQAGGVKVSENDAQMVNDYKNSLKPTEETFDKFDRLLQASKQHPGVFNLAGESWYGPIAGKITPQLSSDPTEHHAVARTFLPKGAYSTFKNVDQGAAEAQAAWAKNLVSGAGGRLTNADLALGKTAKGVGVETTYEAHMLNLAKNMQDIRTAYYRAKEFQDWSAKNPTGTAAEFELTPYYKEGSKIDAAKDVAKKFMDVPEVIGKGGDKYIREDKKGKKYVVINGEGYYL